MQQRWLAGVLIVVLTSESVAFADTAATAQGVRHSSTPVWTFVGAGAGFGLGVWAGLTAFDDAINSARKVWTTAIVSAIAGGVLGYLVDRQRGKAQSKGTFGVRSAECGVRVLRAESRVRGAVRGAAGGVRRAGCGGRGAAGGVRVVGPSARARTRRLVAPHAALWTPDSGLRTHTPHFAPRTHFALRTPDSALGSSVARFMIEDGACVHLCSGSVLFR